MKAKKGRGHAEPIDIEVMPKQESTVSLPTPMEGITAQFDFACKISTGSAKTMAEISEWMKRMFGR